MELWHVALQIKNINEAENFYGRLLGFEKLYNFEIDAETAHQIFGVSKSLQVIKMQKDHLFLELFVDEQPVKMRYQHLCIAVDSVKKLAEECKRSGYQVISKERTRGVLYFIKDATGNMFELKQK
ncbi:MAG: VOC family protein [Bacteroidales bacterium]|nr:VOC family protein [Bacteroidales bacterium]